MLPLLIGALVCLDIPAFSGMMHFFVGNMTSRESDLRRLRRDFNVFDIGFISLQESVGWICVDLSLGYWGECHEAEMDPSVLWETG